MRRHTPQHYYAFDLLWLYGRDLRELPLIGRKQRLKRLIRPPVLYLHHIEASSASTARAAVGPGCPCHQMSALPWRLIFNRIGRRAPAVASSCVTTHRSEGSAERRDQVKSRGVTPRFQRAGEPIPDRRRLSIPNRATLTRTSFVVKFRLTTIRDLGGSALIPGGRVWRTFHLRDSLPSPPSEYELRHELAGARLVRHA
jgi:hypothetical protein